MTDNPDFEALRAKRNESVQATIQRLANEYGIAVDKVKCNHSMHACYCACGTGGPCEHDWNGPDWVSEDGCASSVTCTRCGTAAMSHDMRYAP